MEEKDTTFKNKSNSFRQKMKGKWSSKKIEAYIDKKAMEIGVGTGAFDLQDIKDPSERISVQEATKQSDNPFTLDNTEKERAKKSSFSKLEKDIKEWTVFPDLATKWSDVYSTTEIAEQYEKFHTAKGGRWGKLKESQKRIKSLVSGSSEAEEYNDLVQHIKDLKATNEPQEEVEKTITALGYKPSDFESLLNASSDKKKEGFFEDLFNTSDEEKKRPIFQRMFKGSL